MEWKTNIGPEAETPKIGSHRVRMSPTLQSIERGSPTGIFERAAYWDGEDWLFDKDDLPHVEWARLTHYLPSARASSAGANGPTSDAGAGSPTARPGGGA